VKLKDLASFFSFFLVKPLYEVYIIRIKEQVGERMSTVCSHKYVDCLLENRSREHIKCVFNEKLEHVDDFSFRELVGRIRMVIYKVKKYYDTRYTRSGVNQMCILKNSKELLEYIQSRSLSSCNSIKTFDYSNLYTTISHSKRMLVQLCFILISMSTVCWKTGPESISNVFSMKNSSMLMISVSENLLVESEWLFTK
jgi:hypothetical protein